LDSMNNSRSTCVIIKSNLVTCYLCGSTRSQQQTQRRSSHTRLLI
ncbi:hypothetical protein T06_6022, partial [Trichinella sp. T6]